jgi:hypothetical protein
MVRIVLAVTASIVAMTRAAYAYEAPVPSNAIPAPSMRAGDNWVFDQTAEKGQTGFADDRINLAVERVDGDTMLVGMKRDGAPTGYVDSILGADWSRRLLLNGQETVTNRPFAFPMAVGEQWSSDWDGVRHGNVLSIHSHRDCVAMDWEDVKVPAGTFHAIKIVCKGVDEGTVDVASTSVSGTSVNGTSATSLSHAQKGGVQQVSNGVYSETYYVPEVKYYVRSVDERYSSTNVRLTRTTSVLSSYTPAN